MGKKLKQNKKVAIFLSFIIVAVVFLFFNSNQAKAANCLDGSNISNFSATRTVKGGTNNGASLFAEYSYKPAECYKSVSPTQDVSFILTKADGSSVTIAGAQTKTGSEKWKLAAVISEADYKAALEGNWLTFAVKINVDGTSVKSSQTKIKVDTSASAPASGTPTPAGKTADANATAAAAAADKAGGGGGAISFSNPLKFDSVDGLLTSLLNSLQGIIVTLSLIFIVIGGIFYITSAGNEKRLTAAKGSITAALIGLAIGIAAPSFLKEISTILGWNSAPSNVTGALTLTQISLKVLDFLLSIAGVIALIMLVAGGVGYVTSAGEEKRIESSKKIILYSIIGITVTLTAMVIAKQIAKFFV